MKKPTSRFTLIFALTLFNWGCEDQIYPELPSTDPILVIDAWVNNLAKPQVITLTYTKPYFDNTAYTGATGAQVSVVDNEGTQFDFVEGENGAYTWTPLPGETFGTIGNSYTLTVQYEGKTYTSTSKMNRVPEIDTIFFRHEQKDYFVGGEAYVAEFSALDPVGPGDTYWIKTFKNEQFLSKPAEINIAYDAAFSAGGNYDGFPFIPPIRENINPFDQTPEEDQFYPPYQDGDSVYVEIHSISNAAFNFLTQVITQTDRPGGFAAFFAKPLSNIDTNITSSDGTTILGFFSVSAVEGYGTRLDTSLVPKDE